MMCALFRVLLTGYDYLVLYLGLIWLGILCLTWSTVAMIVYSWLPERYGRVLGCYAIMTGFRLYLSSLSLSRRCSFDLTALDALRGEPAMILAPNHPCLLDAVMIISRLLNIACMLKANLMNNVFLGARLARHIRNDPVRRMVQDASGDFNCGSHLLLFPEGTRTTSYPVEPLRRVMRGQRWMRHFDFDPEAVVQLFWRGVRPINLLAPVRYYRKDEGGVSHFRYLRDNLLLTWMHMRLFTGFVLRLPVLLARRIRG